MVENKLTNPSQVRKIIHKYEFRFKKRLGQNFLVDKNILDKIIASAQLPADSYVIEIGTGIGTLTFELANRCKQVVTFEIDEELVQIFDQYNTAKNIHQVLGDALKLDWQKALQKTGWQDEPVSLVANLPYYITSPLIMMAFESQIPFDEIVIMVQKEVADRIRAKPGTKAYGLLTLAIQYYAEVQFVTTVPRRAFMPAPEVDSAVIKLVPHKTRPDIDDTVLFTVMRQAFAQRRKTLKNALKGFWSELGITGDEFEQILLDLGLEPNVRGEELSLSIFCELTKNCVKSK